MTKQRMVPVGAYIITSGWFIVAVAFGLASEFGLAFSSPGLLGVSMVLTAFSVFSILIGRAAKAESTNQPWLGGAHRGT